jgi:dipeptidyl aminopeptidase/acylaminoacyl peptidase
VLDLTGTPVWSVPPEVGTAVPDLSLSRLSPDRRWLAHALSSDAGLDVEIVALEAPFERITVTRNGGGDSRAIVWAPDSASLYFTDRDDSGIVQLFRAAADGGGVEVLTTHTDPGEIINDVAPSPDGRRLAYAARSAEVFQQPYAHDPADEGWVGLVDLESGATRRVAFPKLGAVENERGLWWGAGGSALLVIGDSLPVAVDDPLAGRRAHWITAEGDPERSFHQKDAPDGYAGWMMPLRDINTLLLNGLEGNYTLSADGFRRVPPALLPPVGQTMDRRVIGILPAPLGFPGEAACP